MKKFFIYSLLAAVLFGNSGAGCGNNKADDPQPEQMQTLIGKWEAVSAKYTITEHNGTVKTTGPDFKSNGTIIIWEFFSDGRMKATANTGPGGATQTREVRWSLNARQIDPNGDINDGTLTIIGNEERELAKTLGQSGDLTYDIGTIGKSVANGTTKMYLSVDATKVGPYKKNILTYTYQKL